MAWTGLPSARYFDATRRYVDAIAGLSDQDRAKIFEGNALRVYPRLNNQACART